MSDVAGTPLPTSGSTTQTNTNSAGHSPTFTETSDGFTVTEIVTTAIPGVCSQTTFPSDIQYYTSAWWGPVYDEWTGVNSSITHDPSGYFELFSVDFVYGGTISNPFHSLNGKKYYFVNVSARLAPQTNYPSGGTFQFRSLNYWVEGYLPTAFRVTPNTSTNPCLDDQSVPGFGTVTGPVAVAQSVSASPPTTGSTVQTATGIGGGTGFGEGGGGGGWSDCDGDGENDRDGSGSNDSNWNALPVTTHAPTFTSTSDGINIDGELPPGTYLVSYRHRVREIRANPAGGGTGPAYDAVQTYGWASLGTTTDPSKWGVGSTTTANPSGHWPTSSTSSPCITGNGYAGIICSCALDTVEEFLTYEGLPYNNPYKVTSFTSERCISPSIGNSAYKILTEGELELKFDLISTPNLFTLPTTGSTTQTAVGNAGYKGFIDGGGGDGWMDCDGDGENDGDGGGGNDSYWNQIVPEPHSPTYIETDHPGGFSIDRTYPGDPSNALPGGGHNWEIKYTIHQIQYQTVSCINGSVTNQINYDSPDKYHMIYDSVQDHPVSVRVITNNTRITSTGCSAPQGWNLTQHVPITVETTYTGTNAGTTSQRITPPIGDWNNGTLGGSVQAGLYSDTWITLHYVKRDGVIQ